MWRFKFCFLFWWLACHLTNYQWNKDDCAKANVRSALICQWFWKRTDCEYEHLNVERRYLQQNAIKLSSQLKMHALQSSVRAERYRFSTLHYWVASRANHPVCCQCFSVPLRSLSGWKQEGIGQCYRSGRRPEARSATTGTDFIKYTSSIYLKVCITILGGHESTNPRVCVVDFSTFL